MPPLKITLVLLCLPALLPPARLHAEGAAPTLEAALAHAKPSSAGFALTLDAASVTLPKEAVLPGDPLAGPEVGALYGQKTQLFGAVTAIAPPTITVVYAPPETPNPYDGMPPGQVMHLLCPSFTPAQWKAFLSPAGVGYFQMTSEAQTALFGALFPGGHLEIVEDNPIGDNDPNSKRDFSGDALKSARLRLGSMTTLALQSTDDPNSHLFGAGMRPAHSPPRFIMTNVEVRDVNREYGAQVRESVPNTPKAGQIAFDAPALKAAVPLAGVKTVDDLIERIGQTVKTEIYADPRFGSRRVTLSPAVGPPSAPAADLLQAAALCVGGVYRRVGPAYVLTDDVLGLGTKHAAWKEFEDKAQRLLPGGDPFSPAMAANPDLPYTVKDIPDSGDPLAFTPQQREQYWNEWAKLPGQTSRPSFDVTVPFSRLSPAQKEAAEMMQADNEKHHWETRLGGTVTVQESPMVEALLPSVRGPIEIFESYDSLLPYPELTPAEKVAERKHFKERDPELADFETPAPDFSLTLRRFSRRAAKIAPATAKETSQEMAALQALGFSEVWVQIAPGPAASDADAPARLAQAVAEGKKRGLRVLPSLSLLHWAQGTDPSVLDCDIQGKTVFPRYSVPFSPAASPFAPAVARRMSGLVRALGSVSGIGGMVWEDTLSTGYEAGAEEQGSSGTGFGYGDAGRLAFLRLAHADPMDLVNSGYSVARANVQVPGFGDGGSQDRRLFTAWCHARTDTERRFLMSLAAALPPPFAGTGPRLPLLLPPSSSPYFSSIGSWDSLLLPPPDVRFISPTGPDGRVLEGGPSRERMASALAYHKIRVYLPPSPSLTAFRAAAARTLEAAAKQGETNVVLDLTDQTGLLREIGK